MGELLPKQRSEARKRGWTALAAWTAAALLGWNLSWWLAAPLLLVAGWLTRSWFLYRAQWGLRF
jgi:hypothetical protein